MTKASTRHRHIYYHRPRPIRVTLFDTVMAAVLVMLISYVAVMAIIEGWL
jgi:hypothetical protein